MLFGTAFEPISRWENMNMNKTIKRIFLMIFWYKTACLIRYAIRKFIRKPGMQRFITPKNLVGRRGTPIARKLREVGFYQ